MKSFRPELLDLPVHVTEHQPMHPLRKYLECDGNTVLPHVPQLQDPIFGPRMLAMIDRLKSRADCSYSTVALWMSDVLGCLWQADATAKWAALFCRARTRQARRL